MKIRLLFLILSSLIWIQSHGCDCKGKTLREYQKTEFNNAKMVFIADVLSSDKENGTYKLRIVEVFKGQLKDSVVSGEYRTSCSGFAEGGRWIIAYGARL